MGYVYFHYVGLVHIGVGNEQMDEVYFCLGQVSFLDTGLIWKIFKLEFLCLHVYETHEQPPACWHRCHLSLSYGIRRTKLRYRRRFFVLYGSGLSILL
jgi:hypothetical protein